MTLKPAIKEEDSESMHIQPQVIRQNAGDVAALEREEFFAICRLFDDGCPHVACQSRVSAGADKRA